MAAPNEVPKALRYWAAAFLLLAAICCYKTGVNLVAYFRMRTLPVEVVNSSVLAAVTPERDPYFVLRLDLHATDASDRRVHWEEELDQAGHIEEAYDELRFWAIGTKHTVQFLRGEAREIRIEGASYNRELSYAGGWTFGAGFSLVLAVVFLSVMAAEDSFLRRLGVHKFAGPWLAFAVFGFLPLIGAMAFAITETPKRFQWQTAKAEVVKRENLPPAPANVTIAPEAKEVLEQKKAEYFLKHEWNGRTLYGGIGAYDSAYYTLAQHCSEMKPTCEFRISPAVRWDMAPRMEFNSDYWVPLGVLTLFGVVFTGAGLLVRKLMSNELFQRARRG